MNRRHALQTTATALIATAATTSVGTLLAGCLGDETDDRDADSTVTTTADDTATETEINSTTTTTADTDDCPGATRLSFEYEPVESEDIVLRSSADSVAVGDTLSIRFRNRSAVEQTTGNRNKVDVQRQTTDGWKSVFGRLSEQVWTDEAILHEPGEGFDWKLSVGDDGFTFDESLRPEYLACDPVEPGQYRFVFWGIVSVGSDESDTEPALTRRFRVTEA